MCCSTGVCGPTVDPLLAAFAADVDWLRAKGVSVSRYNLAQDPQAFVSHPLLRVLEPAPVEPELLQDFTAA